MNYLKKFKPDVVLCVHYLPLEILGHMRAKKDAVQPMTVCVVTDFEAHAFWMEPFVDFYCVAADETKASLAARGVPAGDIAVTGIPIAPKFSKPVDCEAVRRRYGLRDDLPTMLVSGAAVSAWDRWPRFWSKWTNCRRRFKPSSWLAAMR